MATILSDITIKSARKDHACDACRMLLDVMSDIKDDLLPEEVELINQAKADGYKILKGQSYHKQVNIFEGDFGVFKSRIGLLAILQSHGMFDE